MKKRCWMILGFVAAAACSMPPPPAPEPAAEPVTGPMQPPPVFALIGSRERLNLTSEQISALDSIGRWNSSVNDSAMRVLRLGDPRTRRPGDPETDSLVRSVRQNNQHALEGVRSLLTDEQRREVCALFPVPEGRGEGEPGAQRRTRAGEQRGADRREGQGAGFGRFVWPWCITEGSPETAPEPEPPPTEPPG